MHNHSAFFRQLNRIGFKVARRTLEFRFIRIQPGVAVEQNFLPISDIIDILFQRAFRNTLEVGINRQLDVVAIRRFRRRKRSADCAVSINFHNAFTHALRRAWRKPILHCLFHAVKANQVRQRISLILIRSVVRVVILNFTDITDNMACQCTVGIHALRAHPKR